MATYEETLVNITLDADSSIGFYTGVPGMPGSADPNWGRQYRFVKITGAHRAGLASATTDKILGVLQNKPQHPGEGATVAIAGVSNVHSGAAVNAGDYITCDSVGRGIAVSGGAKVRALALGSCAAIDQLFPALLILGA